jgi:hypothetical protein
MTKEEYKILEEIDFNQYNGIEIKISESYEQSKRVLVADAVSTFLYFLGFITLVTLQNFLVLSNSGRRKYK